MFKFVNKLSFGQGVSISLAVILIIPVVLSWTAYILKWAYKIPLEPNSATILAGITGMIGSAAGGFLTLWGVKLTLNTEARNDKQKEYVKQLSSVIYLINELETIEKNINIAKAIMKPNILTGKMDCCVRGHIINRKDWDLHIGNIFDIKLQYLLWGYWSMTKIIDEDISKDTKELMFQIENEIEGSKRRLLLQMDLKNIEQNRWMSWGRCFITHEVFTKEMLKKLNDVKINLNKEFNEGDILSNNLAQGWQSSNRCNP